MARGESREAELAHIRAKLADLAAAREELAGMRATLAAADALAEEVRRRRANGDHGNCEPGDCEQCDALAAYDRARKGA